ncbi:MAG: radical SAM protein [Candidatus Omnitrophota bacterium]
MHRKEDIIFVISPSVWYENMYPTGVLCLSGYLKQRGFDNVILDSGLSDIRVEPLFRERLLLKKIIDLNPKLVCFSATHREFEEVVRMNQELKKANNDVLTIVGGSQPTYRFSDFLDNGFDFACVGEGEATLYEFVREIYGKARQWGSVRGLVWKDKGLINVNPPRPLMSEDEMNAMELLPYEKIDPRYFSINIGTIRGLPVRGALLLTSRGCPFNCSYCGCNLVFGRQLRFRSFDRMEEEVSYLRKKFDVEGIWIVDDTFTITREHVVGVAKILKKYGLIWGCQSRVDTIDKDLMDIMARSGCVQIDFGVESGSQRILDEVIGKKTNIDQIVRAFSLAKKHKLRTLANFMMGFPTETDEEFKETERIADLIDSDVYIFSIATPLPGTRLYEMVNEKISPMEYSRLNFNGTELSEKLNKSGIRNLCSQRSRLFRKYSMHSVRRLVFSTRIYRFFINHKHKRARLLFVFRFLIDKYIKVVFCLPK